MPWKWPNMNVERMNHKWSVNLVAIFDKLYLKLGQEHCKEYNDEAELYPGYHYFTQLQNVSG